MGTEQLHSRRHHTSYLQKALHLGLRDRCFLNSWHRKEPSQKSDSTVMQSCNEGLFVTRGPTSPVTPTSSEFLRWDDRCFRKEEPYQHRPAMFSTSGEDARKKTKWWGERSGPPSTHTKWGGQGGGYQALSKEDKIGHQSLKLCPASLVLTQYDIPCSSDISTYINEKIKIRKLTLEQLHAGEMKWNSQEGRGGSRIGESVRLQYHTVSHLLSPNFIF